MVLGRAAPLALALAAGGVWGRERSAGCEPRLATSPREEFFVLECSLPADAGARAAVEQVGLARWSARGGERAQVELEARFFEDGLRVHQVESASGSERELVWREWRPSDGRTLIARARGGALDLVEWGRHEPLRTSLPAPADLCFPLHLVEALRIERGALQREALLRFDPLGRRSESLQLVEHERAGDVRTLELRDDSGACAGRYEFDGERLRSFRWQGGALIARAIEPADYARLAQERTGPAAER